MLVLEFKAEYRADKQVDWVKIAPKGEALDRVQTWHRVNELRPREDVDEVVADSDHYKAMLARWAVIQPAYEAWRSGQALPENGTPLAAWAGVTPEMVEHLRRMHVRTVEDVAEMKDADTRKLPFPTATKLPELAKAYLSGRTSAAKDEELAAMRERMAALEAALEVPEKRGPGRPRKEPEAA